MGREELPETDVPEQVDSATPTEEFEPVWCYWRGAQYCRAYLDAMHRQFTRHLLHEIRQQLRREMDELSTSTVERFIHRKLELKPTMPVPHTCPSDLLGDAESKHIKKQRRKQRAQQRSENTARMHQQQERQRNVHQRAEKYHHNKR